MRNRSFLGGFQVLLSLVALLTTTPLIAFECVAGDVRDMVDAIINQNPAEAEVQLQGIRDAYPNYQLADFYQSTIHWSRNQFTESPSKRRSARREMLKAIELLEERVDRSRSLDNRFNLGVAQGLAARMFIFDEEYLKAYRLGSAAKDHISAVYTADPERNDARFFIGLFEYYTSAVPDEFSWFSRLINWNGNREIGVKHLEYAVQNAPTFAHEAARALLMEVNWQLPRVCEYLPLAEWLASKNIDNPYFSLTLQGVYLRCGQPDKALFYNEELAGLGLMTLDIRLARHKAKLRALAQSGDVETIKSNGYAHLSAKNRFHYWFALANAYDVVSMRDKAQNIYHKIIKMNDLAERFKSMAELRLDLPYQAPNRVESHNTISIASACH